MTIRETLDNKELLQSAIESTDGTGEALTFLGLKRHTHNHRLFKAACEKYGLTPKNHSWFSGDHSQKFTLLDYLAKDGPRIDSTSLRKKLIAEGVLKAGCSIPGCPVENGLWLGQPISLHLDHINGDNKDNRIDNLRILCPSCHAQTPTHSGKNNRTEATVIQLKLLLLLLLLQPYVFYTLPHGWQSVHDNLNDREIFQQAIEQTPSIRAACEYLGLPSIHYRQFHKACALHQIKPKRHDFVENPTSRGQYEYPINYYLNLDGPTIASAQLKKRLWEVELLLQKCSGQGCTITTTWNDIGLVLQLDHINGIHTDNRLKNLRILCPNCHCQTDTHSGKNNIKQTVDKICCEDSCTKKIGQKSTRCKRCASIHLKSNNLLLGRKAQYDWPPLDVLIEMLETMSWTAVGKQLGCSDNAVRKHLIHRGIDPKQIKKKTANCLGRGSKSVYSANFVTAIMAIISLE